jgi:hypothetical protein
MVPTAEGGRRQPFVQGSRPHIAIRHGYLTSAHFVAVDPDPLVPGASGIIEVSLITPDAYPGTLWPGRTIPVHEAARLVGFATVLAVHNPLLLADRLPSEWNEEPPELLSIEAALRALVADAPVVRLAALRYLASQGDEVTLRASMDDPDPHVRAMVRAMLDRP